MRFRATIYRLRKMARNLLFDLRHGALIGVMIDTRFPDQGARETSSTDYAVLPILFDGLIQPADVLVDVGCGRGRVILWWLDQGLRNKIVGIELDPEVADYARERTKKSRNVRIVTGNVLQSLPGDATVFYLYNPFEQWVVERFKRMLEEQFGESHPVTVVYYNCLHLDVFESDDRWSLRPIDLSRVPGSRRGAVLRLDPHIPGRVQPRAASDVS